MKNLFSTLLSTCFIIGCKTNVVPSKLVETRDFPPVRTIAPSDSATFVTTMQHPCGSRNNVVYTPALLYAWDEFRSMQGDIEVPANYTELSLINTSASHTGTLEQGEYSVDAKVTGNRLILTAAFAKGLPFTTPMDTTQPREFKFMGTPVKAFGIRTYYDKTVEETAILFYYNDDKFVVKLSPKNDSDEIILSKGLPAGKTLEQLYDTILACIQRGTKDQPLPNNSWKYRFSQDDKLLIPIMRMNYRTEFSSLEDAHVLAGKTPFTIAKAAQRTAFILDEIGAKVESEAQVDMAAAAAPPPYEEKPHPKIMLFDKPYVVVLKKKNARYPYFMMCVNNPGIMQKQ